MIYCCFFILEVGLGTIGFHDGVSSVCRDRVTDGFLHGKRFTLESLLFDFLNVMGITYVFFVW